MNKLCRDDVDFGRAFYDGMQAAPYGGLFVIGGHIVQRGIGSVYRTYDLWRASQSYRSVSRVQANKAAGDAVRDAIALREAPALVEQSFRTVGGIRKIDVLKVGDRLVGIESKVGRRPKRG